MTFRNIAWLMGPNQLSARSVMMLNVLPNRATSDVFKHLKSGDLNPVRWQTTSRLSAKRSLARTWLSQPGEPDTAPFMPRRDGSTKTNSNGSIRCFRLTAMYGR
jgi:hypothetical protein